MNLEKKNIPENCLLYVNQSYLSTVKNGDIAMYHDNFILGQLLIAANQLTEIENYACEANEVKFHTCIYDLTIGEFQGLKTELDFIVLRGDKKSYFCLMVLSQSLLFYILHQNKKFLMLLYKCDI